MFQRIPHRTTEARNALSSLLLFPYNFVGGFVRGVTYIVGISGIADDIEGFTHNYPRVVVISKYKHTNTNIPKADWSPKPPSLTQCGQ